MSVLSGRHLAPGCWPSEREENLRRFERLAQLLLKSLQLFMCRLLDDQALELAELGFEQGLDEDGVAVYCLLVQSDNVHEG